jgi:hypothetical protein
VSLGWRRFWTLKNKELLLKLLKFAEELPEGHHIADNDVAVRLKKQRPWLTMRKSPKESPSRI